MSSCYPQIYNSSPPSTPLSDCPSNLKEAIDWILRVTGKDGGSGDDGTNALTGEVKNLLREVEESDTKIGGEIKKVKEALGNSGTGNGLITKLAEGLQQFIGYDGTLANRGPLITGAGILPANVAKHQVCNAVLNFVIRFLEGLCGIEKLESQNKEGVKTVIGTLRKCVGTGKLPTGFGELVEGIKGKVEQGFDKKINSRGGNGTLNTVFSALKGISDTFNNHQHQSQTVDSAKLDSLFSVVDSAVQNDNNLYFSTYCDKLKSLFENQEIKNNAQQDGSALNYEQLKASIGGVTGATPNLNGEIRKINTNTNQKNLLPNAAVFTAVRDAATAFIAELQTKTYTSYYDKKTNPQAEWSNVKNNANAVQTCAKIFLGCLPLYYQALTYIYWGCHEKGGGWGNLTLANGALRSYFDSQGLLPTFVESSSTGAHIADSALNKFSEFQAAAASSLTHSNNPYVSFTTKLREKLNGSTSGYTDCPLSALFHGASCYFRYQQITTTKHAVNTPKTIREMLYFLAAMPYSTSYGELDNYVTSHFQTVTGSQSGNDVDLKLQVADSGITPKPGSSSSTDTLSAADLKSYITSTFHLAPAFIGLIQDPGTSGEPWLHSLFSNSQFNLSIPSSGPGIFGALSNYTNALQFQLHFLYQQCSNVANTCGWRECQYGSDVQPLSSVNVGSLHICEAYRCGDNLNCQHNSNPCNHDQGGQAAKCGRDSNNSPLQAFLTDRLKGFSRGHPSDPSSHLATCSGYLCHVPMGFNPNDLRAESNANTQGSHISLALGSFCGGFNTPLRQLSEKLGCLTKRTPRSLGDLFGFVWHLNGQLFKNERPALKTIIEKIFQAFELGSYPSLLSAAERYSAITEIWNKIAERKSNSLSSTPTTAKGLSLSLEAMAPAIPFLHQLFTVGQDDFLPTKLFDLTQHCHKKDSRGKITHESATSSGSSCTTHTADLWSLYQPVSAAPTGVGATDSQSACRKAQCGGYFSPLTHSAGTTYAPVHASVYLSWLAYLTDDFHEWFQNFLDEFKNIDCSKTGCRSKVGGPTCGKQHNPGTHGTSDTCTCTSVVHCGGVLPLLYRNGFHYHNAYWLATKNRNQKSRSCQNFQNALSNVLSYDAPLNNLITTIDNFLYAIRWEFFSKLSGFWTIYVCLIVYTFFFLLDTLHLRSHLKLTSSHTVPPLALLTSGKPLPITKLTYINQ
ncbi:extracellular matrix-binding ebh [Babesia caballi]|uniref:Extracellular matrix-binding ebh n=1 Tax=Babesia caballi TaxID=5871 RepID=A0AAV4LN91_BABCB|nr:extracellular matrix-binding ebh [Babesia caballi]